MAQQGFVEMLDQGGSNMGAYARFRIYDQEPADPEQGYLAQIIHGGQTNAWVADTTDDIIEYTGGQVAFSNSSGSTWNIEHLFIDITEDGGNSWMPFLEIQVSRTISHNDTWNIEGIELEYPQHPGIPEVWNDGLQANDTWEYILQANGTPVHSDAELERTNTSDWTRSGSLMVIKSSLTPLEIQNPTNGDTWQNINECAIYANGVYVGTVEDSTQDDVSPGGVFIIEHLAFNLTLIF